MAQKQESNHVNDINLLRKSLQIFTLHLIAEPWHSARGRVKFGITELFL